MNLSHLEKVVQDLRERPSTSSYLKKALEVAYKELGHSHPTTTELLKLYMNLSAEDSEHSRPSTSHPLSKPKSQKHSKHSKRYIFEHYSSNIDNFFHINLENSSLPEKIQKLDLNPKSTLFKSEEKQKSQKISPVKPDKRLVDGIYFEGIDSRPRIDRPCRHKHEEPPSTKSTRDSSKKDLALNLTGRFTPEVRNASARSRGNDSGLPKIRASSSRPAASSFDSGNKRISAEFYSDIKPSPPKELPRPKPPTSARSVRSVQCRKPSSSSQNDLNLASSNDKEIPLDVKMTVRRNGHPSSSQVSRPPTQNKIRKEVKKKIFYPLEKIILIQKMWRGFLSRKKFKAEKRKALSIKGKNAIAELEELKKLASLEQFDMDVNIGKVSRPQRTFKPSVLEEDYEKIQDKMKENRKNENQEKDDQERKNSENSSKRRFDLKSAKNNRKSLNSNLPVIVEAKAEYSDGPVILIQKNVKMFLQRKKYKNLKTAAVKVQSFIRMSNVRELYLNIRNAIVFIQRAWRSFLKRKL
jgi:hypothetical protein